MAFDITMLDRVAPASGQVLLAETPSSPEGSPDAGGHIHLLGVFHADSTDSLGDAGGAPACKIRSWRREAGLRPELVAEREEMPRGHVRGRHAQTQWGATTGGIPENELAVWFSSCRLTAISHSLLDTQAPLTSFTFDDYRGGRGPWRLAEGSGGLVFRVSGDWLEVCAVKMTSPDCELPVFREVIDESGWGPPRPPIRRAYASASGAGVALLSGPKEAIEVWLGAGHSPDAAWTSAGVGGLSFGADIAELAFVAADRMLLGIDADGDVTSRPLTAAAAGPWRWRCPRMQAGAFPSTGARHRLSASPGGETVVAGFVSGLVAVLTLNAAGGLSGTRIVGCGPSDLRGPLVVAPGGHTLVTGHRPPLVWRLDGDEPRAWCLAAGDRGLAAAAVGRSPSWGAFLLEDGDFGAFDASVAPEGAPPLGAGTVTSLLSALPEVQRGVAKDYATLFSRPRRGRRRAAARVAKKREAEFVGMTAAWADYLARMAVLAQPESAGVLMEGEEEGPTSSESERSGNTSGSLGAGPSFSYGSLASASDSDGDGEAGASHETESALSA